MAQEIARHQVSELIRTINHVGDILSRTVDIGSNGTTQLTSDVEADDITSAPCAKVAAFVVSDATLPDLPIVYVNEAFERLTGYAMAEIVGMNCRFLQGRDTNQPGLIELRAAIREKRACRTVLRNYRKDGSSFWNDFSLTPVLNGAGEVTHLLGIQNTVRQQDLLQTRVSSSTSTHDSLGDGKDKANRLGDILVELGVLSKATVFAAAQLQQAGENKRIGEILVERFRVAQGAIIRALSIQVENERAAHTQTDVFLKTAFAVRLAQKTMEAIPENGLPIFSICQPLTDAGGDTFYRVLLNDGTHLLVLADVAGHSVLSSYAVASFLGMLCALTRDFKGLKKLLLDINSCLQSGPFGDVPICVLAAHWNMQSGRLHLINAAVPHAVWYHATTGESTTIALDGNPLGIIDEPALSEQVVVLRAGDRLVFGSDGVFEAPSPEALLFQDIAKEQWSLQAGSSLGKALFGFCESARQHARGKLQDDVLVVAIEQPPYIPTSLDLCVHIQSNYIAVDEACVCLVDFVNSRAELKDQPDDWQFGLLLVAREALTNAVIHGNQEDPTKSICLQCKSDPDLGVLFMIVTDEGTGYPAESERETQDLQVSERGRGLSIIREFTQSMHTEANELHLEFSLKGNSNG